MAISTDDPQTMWRLGFNPPSVENLIEVPCICTFFYIHGSTFKDAANHRSCSIAVFTTEKVPNKGGSAQLKSSLGGLLYIHIAVQPVSRTLSSWQTETLYPLNGNSFLPALQPLSAVILLYLFEFDYSRYLELPW